MRKVWNTLVVLGILLCMIVSMGVTADAAEGDAAIFAVSGEALAPESIDVMKTDCPDCLVVDVDGLAEGQSAAGYTAVYTPSEPTEPTDFEAVWPGAAKIFDVGTQDRKVVLVGLDETITADAVAGALSQFVADDPYVIAMGPAAAAATVSLCADVDMFLTVGLDDAAAGTATVVNVGKQPEAPVSLVKVNADGTASVEAVPVPQPASDPNVQPAEQAGTEGETAGDGTEVGIDGMLGVGPVIDAPAEDAPETVIYYAVTYDGNGRDEGTFVPDDMEVPNNEPYTLRDNGYTREGYSFVGWTLDVPDGETVYQPGDSITVSANTTVYAKWAPVEAAPEGGQEPAPEADPNASQSIAETTSYTITYKPGTGAGDEQAYAIDSGKEITLSDGAIFTAPEGTQFSGWQNEATGEMLAGGAAYVLTDNVNFVAQYAPVQVTFTVTYDFGESATAGYTQTVAEGETCTLPGADAAVAPEGKVFGGWLVNGELKAAGEQFPVTADLTVAAQWNDAPAEDVTFTVTYKSGIENVPDVTAPEPVPAGGSITLPENPFGDQLPAGMTIKGWKLDGGDGTVIPVGQSETVTANAVYVAEIETVQPTAPASYTVTYLNEDGTTLAEATTDAPNEAGEVTYTLLETLPEGVTPPEGKVLGGWKNGETVRKPGQEVTLTGNSTFTVVWGDAAKAKVDPAAQTKTELAYVNGASEQLEIAFSNGVNVNSVSVDGTALALNSQYGVVPSGDTTTVYFLNTYLNGLTVGSHEVNITFTATSDTEYTPYTGTLTVSAQDSVSMSWDRSQNLIIDFAKYGRGNPTKVQLLRAYEKDANGEYKKDENGKLIPIWSDLTKDQDYTINGTSVTLYPSLLGSWKNQQYGFRVTFDGAGTDKGVTTMNMNLTTTGTVLAASASATAAPTGSSGYVTGDSVNLRAGAGTSNQVLRTVAKGTKLTIYSVSNGWAYVSVDGVTGYMSADYIAYDNVTPTATPTGAVSPATGDNNNVVLYIVLLVVLIIALAAVLIIVIKRRKN